MPNARNIDATQFGKHRRLEQPTDGRPLSTKRPARSPANRTLVTTYAYFFREYACQRLAHDPFSRRRLDAKLARKAEAELNEWAIEKRATHLDAALKLAPIDAGYQVIDVRLDLPRELVPERSIERATPGCAVVQSKLTSECRSDPVV